jgi:hypothetical protein
MLLLSAAVAVAGCPSGLGPAWSEQACVVVVVLQLNRDCGDFLGRVPDSSLTAYTYKGWETNEVKAR